jgi:5,10-methylenetetrahydromethanopterin reductase
MAGQGPKARALAKEITDGLISLGGPAEGFETCLVSTNGTVLDDGEDVTSPRASTAVKPLIALAYHFSVILKIIWRRILNNKWRSRPWLCLLA